MNLLSPPPIQRTSYSIEISNYLHLVELCVEEGAQAALAGRHIKSCPPFQDQLMRTAWTDGYMQVVLERNARRSKRWGRAAEIFRKGRS